MVEAARPPPAAGTPGSWTRWRSGRCRCGPRWRERWCELRPTVIRGNASEIIALAGARRWRPPAWMRPRASRMPRLQRPPWPSVPGGAVAVSPARRLRRRRRPRGPDGQRRPPVDQGDRGRLRPGCGHGGLRGAVRRPLRRHRGRRHLVHRRRRAGRRTASGPGSSRSPSWTRWPRWTPETVTERARLSDVRPDLSIYLVTDTSPARPRPDTTGRPVAPPWPAGSPPYRSGRSTPPGGSSSTRF